MDDPLGPHIWRRVSNLWLLTSFAKKSFKIKSLTFLMVLVGPIGHRRFPRAPLTVGWVVEGQLPAVEVERVVVGRA